jgi:exopolysaccharide biosynthesis WecB/TagA/CpsF family protein
MATRLSVGRRARIGTGSALKAPARRVGRLVDVLGCPIDAVDLQMAVDLCIELARGEEVAIQDSVNAAKVVECATDPRMAEFVRNCDLVNADGQAVVWASRLLGQPLPERVPGVDLMQGLFSAAAAAGISVYVLGATEEVLQAATRRMNEEHPDLELAGARDGYFSEAEEAEIVRDIRESGARILIVAISSPLKELFLAKHREELGVGLALGVGGSVDVYAGHVSRAPDWVQALGLEWLYRVIQEPNRLWRRYLVKNTHFGWLLVKGILRRRGGRRVNVAPGIATSRGDRLARARLLATHRGEVMRATTIPPMREEIMGGALEAAIGYLCRTQDATAGQGSSKGFHLLKGWQPAYPETSGYVIGTLLEYSRLTDDMGLRERARQLGWWEIMVQNPDGGVMEGVVSSGSRSVAFDTGMVLHGWLDLVADGVNGSLRDATTRAAAFLLQTQDSDGAWRGAAAYRGLPTTYHSRVAWALLRYDAATSGGDMAAAAAGRRHLEWVLRQQRPNGWFKNCTFAAGLLPNTHAIAYTIRGLLESGLILDEQRYVDAAVLTSENLIAALDDLGTLPGTFDESWRPGVRWVCLTGLVQLGDVWLKLAEVTGERRFRQAGVKAIAQAAGRQERQKGAAHGALPGSYPIFGRYAPLQYPNWATKFLADALMTLEKGN